MIKLAVAGAQGRMGKSIVGIALSIKKDVCIVKALFESKERTDLAKEFQGVPIYTDLSALQGCDVLIDFTTPHAVLDNLEACEKYNVGMVIGTTGLSPAEIGFVENASKNIPIVFSSNMSFGVNVLFKLIEQTSKTMKNFFNKIVIEETHHEHKKDKPSGTAKTMREIAEQFSGTRISDDDMISHREGEVVGDHTIIYETPFDTITISHHAKTRDMFAIGAVNAAEWLMENKKKNGLYNMKDVFGLK
ncbi:MAG: 4-hydroxy-tetrahydrodipicolinate reductase [Candidatus Omnitrophota bacterium]|nr:4-hydroxy-tetrahydrodipicolinate reductase [Candidatus Omnitrophota bacterium]